MKHSTMRKLTLQVAFTLLCISSGYSQWQWLSPGYTNLGNYSQSSLGVAVDPNGGVYTTGYYLDSNTKDFQISLRKFSADGKLLYFKLINNGIGKDVNEVGNDIGVSLANNIVVIGGQKHGGLPYLGFFRADNGSPAAFPQVAFSGAGEITKIDIQGNFVWVIGNFESTLYLGAGGPTYTGNGSPTGNIFIAKYNLITGAYVSSTYLQGGYLKAYDIKVDNSGNAYFTAMAFQTVNFFGTPAFSYTASNAEGFIAKLNSNYGVIWRKSLATAYGSVANYARYPICLIPGGVWTVAVGGYDMNAAGSFLQTLSADYGTLFKQITNIPNKAIYDLAAGCSPNLYVLGASYGSSNSLFLDKYNLNNLSLLSGQISNPTALGTALAMDGVSRPVVTGNYDAGVYTINGQSINVPNQRGTVTGLYDETSACCSNRGLILDGINDYVSANGTPLSGNVNFTFEAWVNCISTGTGNFRRLLGWGISGGPQIEIGETGGLLNVKYYNPTLSASINPTISLKNGWHHVAVTRNGSSLIAYVDGYTVGTASIGTFNITSNSFFNIGQKAAATGSATENWKGRIDEVRLWNYARNPTFILTKKDCSLRGNEPGLILYYPFEQGIPSGQNAGAMTAWNYATSISLYGILHNFSLTGSLSNWICASQSGLTMNGTCTPFAPDPISDERAAETENNSSSTPDSKFEVRLFPNPTNGIFYVEFAEPADTDVTLHITDLSGRLLLEQGVESENQQQRVEAEALPAGFYFLQVVLNNKILATQKFVKQ